MISDVKHIFLTLHVCVMWQILVDIWPVNGCDDTKSFHEPILT